MDSHAEELVSGEDEETFVGSQQNAHRPKRGKEQKKRNGKKKDVTKRIKH